MLKLPAILLIEDDEVTNFYNEHVLRTSGLTDTIYTALNGREALSILQAEGQSGDYKRPSLILMDLHMPVMDGWEFLEHYHGLPLENQVEHLIIMLTNPLMPEQRSKAEGFPLISTYLNKPLNTGDLANFLKG